MTQEQINQRAFDLHRQIKAQRATLKTYEQALFFVRVRQMEAVDTVEPIAKQLWTLSQPT